MHDIEFWSNADPKTDTMQMQLFFQPNCRKRQDSPTVE